jgi:hypothetical protein
LELSKKEDENVTDISDDLVAGPGPKEMDVGDAIGFESGGTLEDWAVDY